MADEAKAHWLCQHPGVTDERSGAEHCSGSPRIGSYHTAAVAAETNFLPAVWHISLSLYFVCHLIWTVSGLFTSIICC